MKLLSKISLFALVLVVYFLIVGSAVGPQKTCPVMGGDINTNVYADYNGKRIYFCCSICEPQFKKSPKEFIKKLEAQGVTFEFVNK